MPTILTTLGIALLMNVAVFVPAYLLRTDKLTDVTYALTFVALALYGLVAGPGNSAHGCSSTSGCVCRVPGRASPAAVHTMGRDRDSTIEEELLGSGPSGCCRRHRSW
jgi:hypothetical protein